MGLRHSVPFPVPKGDVKMAMKCRKVSLVCYEEPTQQQLSFAIRWAYILHDKDIKLDNEKNPVVNPETGEVELKKPHYHVYMEFANPRYLSSIAKDYGLPEAAIECVVSLQATLSYLTHRTQKAIADGKYMYEPSDVVVCEDLEYDFGAILDTSETVPWLQIFSMPTISQAMAEFKKSGEVINSLQQFKNFVQTFHTMHQIEREENGNGNGAV